MSNRIPNFCWNRLKLATLTYEQLAQLEEQVKAEHACKNGFTSSTKPVSANSMPLAGPYTTSRRRSVQHDN
ncbi:hypothetical protein Q5Y79_22925 [Klebsiella pneumoniae]|nr:hypothetical protein [Klebsiella pneumoniae]MEC7325362.1 hypothetical protein [Klebsiella pneumoniae]MEC7330861.1 hypothetical protein [Klebsiella pneumoniae]MEC7341200.1 hypothetical protein [Klebsiella pneumoniae]